jgi:hypothetical protein
MVPGMRNSSNVMDEKMKDRLEQIIDPKAYGSDAAYHMMVTLFRQWMTEVEWACKDEDIPDDKTAAILNRLTYGHPYGADALLRIEMDATKLEELKSNPPPSVFMCPRCGRVSHSAHDIKEGYCSACHDWTALQSPRRGDHRLCSTLGHSEPGRCGNCGATLAPSEQARDR